MQIKRNVLLNTGPAATDTVKMAQIVPVYYNLPFVYFDCPIDEIPDLNQVEQILKENQDIALVYTTHNETGTGILNPIKESGFLVHKYSAVFIVDTISTYAMKPIDIEKEALDEYFREGEEVKWKRHSEVFEVIHAGLDKLSFKDIIRRELQAGLGVTVKYPDDENWSFEKVHDYCYNPFSELCIHRKLAYNYTLQTLVAYYIIKYINRDLQMNFLNFPYFSRLSKPHTVNCYVFSLVFALMGSLQGKFFSECV